MLWFCIRKELLVNILSMRYAMTVVLFLTLTLAATASRTAIYRKQLADHHRARSMQREILQASDNIFEIEGLGVRDQKAPNPLAIFVPGLESDLTRMHAFTGHQPPESGLRKLGSPSFRYSLQLDFITIIAVVCSLLALLLLYDAVCGEREQGTLKVLLAGPLPRDIIILSKLTAGLLTVLVPLIMVWLLNIAYVILIARVEITGDFLLRCMGMMGVSSLYIAFFCTLGIAVSAWTQRITTALVINLFAWTIIVLAVPNIVPLFVKVLSPIPPESRITQERNAISEDLNRQRAHWREEAGASGTFTDLRQIDSIVEERWRAEFIRKEAHEQQFFQNRVNRQILLTRQFSRISPSALFVFSSTALAGTGVDALLQLIKDLESHDKEIKRIFSEKRQQWEAWEAQAQKAHEQGCSPEKPPETRVNSSDLPSFRLSRIALTTAFNGILIDIGVLSGLIALCFLGAYIGFIRYDAR